MQKHVSPFTAAQIMLSQPVSLKTERIELRDALGRILAEDVRAAFPMPPFSKSPFDGFAFRAEDVPGTLPICGVIAAGDPAPESLKPNTAVRIFTGAPVPSGADAVTRFEHTVIENEHVTIPEAFFSGKNVIPTGEEYQAGTLLVPKHVKLSPAHLGLIASQGLKSVLVYQRPKAACITTGSELAPPDQERPKYCIYDSSSHALLGYLRQIGFDVQTQCVLPDVPEQIEAAVRQAMDSDADLVFTTGGASVGDYDFAVSTAERIGAEILFWKVRVKPGGALLAATRGGKILLGLSGNPAAAIMSLLTVLQPYLRKLTGVEFDLRAEQLPLRNAMPKSSTSTRMLRGKLLIENGRAWFQEHQGRGNGTISSFVACDLIGIIPPGAGPLKAGELISVLRLPRDLY